MAEKKNRLINLTVETIKELNEFTEATDRKQNEVVDTAIREYIKKKKRSK